MTIIITGATSGIGKALAELENKNHTIIGVARNEKNLYDITSIQRNKGYDYFPIVGDVGIPSTMEKAVEAASKCQDQNLHLVCSAGIGCGGATETLSKGKFRDTMDTNVEGTFNAIQAVLPHMLERERGRIVLISSMAGVKGYKRNIAYCASKHALVGMGRSLALEYGKRGIEIYVICPGFVDTPMTVKMLSNIMKHKKIEEKEAVDLLCAQSPQNRIIPIEEITGFIDVLLSGRFPSLAGQPVYMGDGE